MALALGKTVQEISEMSSVEMTYWMGYFRLEPFGEERSDLRSGIIASTIANVMTGGKNKQTYTPKDFMPYAKRKETVQDKVREVFSKFVK